MPLGRGCRPRGRHEPAEARSRLGERERVPGLVWGEEVRGLRLHCIEYVTTDDRPFSVEQAAARCGARFECSLDEGEMHRPGARVHPRKKGAACTTLLLCADRP